MHKSATKCNEIVGKWCKNKHRASKIIDTLETYHLVLPLTSTPYPIFPFPITSATNAHPSSVPTSLLTPVQQIHQCADGQQSVYDSYLSSWSEKEDMQHHKQTAMK
jgi:hypothetical protein